ncbi:30S ribosomal protein S17 [Candidatus Gottesmanbacteria bacterium]|nr:30S ribosomal protein S17 [Candidatus Gottesmanbacteria bacterium]
MIGKVVSTKMTKTVVVEVVRARAHKLYRKMVRRAHRFAAHNTLEGIAVGDTVKVAEAAPRAKTKHFVVVEKL